MDKFKRCLAIISFIFFEVYAGVRLLSAPAEFSNSAVIVFGVIMLIVGAISLYWMSVMKAMGLPHRLTLIAAIIDLILGVVSVAFSSKVVGAFPTFAKIYGVFMVIMGISKLRDYITLQVWGLPRKFLWLVSAILTIVLGVVIFMNPFTAVEVAWTYTGYFLVITGAVDLFVFILSFFL